jgi:membrane-associated protease RseP (regulator of RpoE activity)
MTFKTDLKAVGAVTALLALPACVSQAGMAYKEAPQSTRFDEARPKIAKSREVDAQFSQDLSADMQKLVQDGYELVGYSKFQGPMQPQFALGNARGMGKKRGASVVRLAPPKRGSLNQYRYLYTFWAKADTSDALFGGYYGDAPKEVLAANGCGANLVALSAVAPGSPADLMGLDAGDIIVDVDEVPVNTARQLDDILVMASGLPVKIRFIRGDTSRIAEGQLGTPPETAKVLKPKPFEFGATTISSKLERSQRKRFKRKNGVFVTGVEFGAHACNVDLRYGDILLSIDGNKIKNQKDVRTALRKRAGTVSDIQIARAGAVQTLQLDLTSEATQQIGYTRRRVIAESGLAEPTWLTDDGADFTWLALGGLVAVGMMEGYQNHLESERQRIAEHNRRAAAMPVNPKTVSKDRNGVWTVSDRFGDSVRIDEPTAIMLRKNPGFSVSSVSRRGNNFAIYDEFGAKVDRPFRPLIIPATTAKIPGIDMSGYYKSLGLKSQFTQAHYNQITSTSPSPSSGIAMQPRYSVFANEPYAGGYSGNYSGGVYVAPTPGRRTDYSLPTTWRQYDSFWTLE